MPDATPFVVVAGNIAVGKSSFVKALGQELGLSVHPERWKDNPWFGQATWGALAAQLWFLTSSATDHADIAHTGGVQERSIYEHALVFAQELLSGNDAQLVTDTYALFDQLLPSPRLIVFLYASPAELVKRVRHRGRPQETDVTLGRLRSLDKRYQEFIDNWTRCPVIRIDSERLDMRVPEDLAVVAQLIREMLV